MIWVRLTLAPHTGIWIDGVFHESGEVVEVTLAFGLGLIARHQAVRVDPPKPVPTAALQSGDPVPVNADPAPARKKR